MPDRGLTKHRAKSAQLLWSRERFVKPSAGICPPATASLLPRAWLYSKKPAGLAELPGFLIQLWVAAPRGKRPLVGNARALLGSEEAGALPAEMGRLGSGWGHLRRVTVGSLAAIPGGSFLLCPTMECCEPLALPGGLGVLINPQGPVFHALIHPILPGGVAMLLPAGGCCACSTAPTPSLAWGRESPVLLGARNQGCASAGPGRRPPVRVDIPRIAVVVPGQATVLPGSTRATAPRSGPKIVTGTVPCPQPGPAHSPSL